MRFLFLLLVSLSAFSQDKMPYPRDYFRSPLDIPLFLSGNFGELRTNHFHAGLDFKTQQKQGLNVYAAADGYVSRIKISPYGYGKAIYIDHPNGYTTVYGHLSKYGPALEEYVKKEQYKQQSFEIDIFPKPGELVVKKGDIIAFSGNTGGSGGPHLHFEFRNTVTEKIINPMFFGFDTLVADTRVPVITGLMVYPLGPDSSVNQSQKPLMVGLSLQPDGSYIADHLQVSGKIGFGISTFDQSNDNYTKTGVYKVQSYLNGNEGFGYEFNTFAFDEGRYVNALLDYPRFKKMGMRLQKLFMPAPYPLSLIRAGQDSGMITIMPNLTDNYKIEVSDFNGNKVVVNVPIDYSPLMPTIFADPELKTPYLLRAAVDNNYKKDNMSVFFPAGTFYEDFYLNFDVRDSILFLHDDSVAVHKNFTVTIENSAFQDADKDKVFIASVNGNRKSYNATKWKGNVFTAQTKDLGQFQLAKDVDAPRISAPNFKQGKWISKLKTLEFTIRDNLSGIKNYYGKLNGNWILFEYDYKTKRITHNLDDNVFQDGRNDLKVVVTDNVGNSAIFETWFFRSKKP